MSRDDREGTLPPPVSLVEGFDDLVLIGRGGSGEVYRSTELAFDRPVAIKVFAATLQDDGAVHEFRRECQAVGRVAGHPNIVRPFGAGRTSDGRPYISMELMEGSLADDLPEHGLPVGQVLRIGIALAGAVETAHRAGVLHCDIKPENVLVSRFGDVALADFGVATMISRTTTSTPGLTLQHAAPEVLEGLPATERSDVYSLASTLYELLTGHAPFDGGDHRSAMRKLVADAPGIDAPHVPDGLAIVLRRSLSRDPGDRPASAMELGRELEAVAASSGLVGAAMVLGDAEPRTGDGPGTDDAITVLPEPPSARRRRAPLLLAVGALLALALVGAALAVRGSRTDGSDQPADRTRPTSTLPESPEELLQLLDQRIGERAPADLDVGRSCVTTRLSSLNTAALGELLALGPGTTANVDTMADALGACAASWTVATAVVDGQVGGTATTLAEPERSCVVQQLAETDAVTTLAVRLLSADPGSTVVDRLVAEQVAAGRAACIAAPVLTELVRSAAAADASLTTEQRVAISDCAAPVIDRMDPYGRSQLGVLFVDDDGLPEPLRTAYAAARTSALTSFVAPTGPPIIERQPDGTVASLTGTTCFGSADDPCAASTDQPASTAPAVEVC